MKAADLIDNGSDAKFEIMEGNVKVNGETASERGKKIKKGDVNNYHSEDFSEKYLFTSPLM